MGYGMFGMSLGWSGLEGMRWNFDSPVPVSWPSVKVMLSLTPGLHHSLWEVGCVSLRGPDWEGGREDYDVSRTIFPQQLRDKNTQVLSM